MTGIITALLPSLLPLAVKLITLAVERQLLSIEQKKAFMDFVQAMATKGNQSKKASDTFARMHERLKTRG